jgi:alkanesulfonate monooxygenase SsuD/methylene tetrahydromethanopterin reductase-like flavin-dependent oxidoreductase (luciferase family)
MKLDPTRMGFGITGSLAHDVVRQLAPRVEAVGFRTLWINHGGDGGNSLASMRVAAEVTSTLRLASGVIPVDRMPTGEVIVEFRERDVPADRSVVGIGASKPPSPLGTVREAAQAIHDELGVPVMVGALGPKMRRLGVRETDGVLLNWLTPEGARLAMDDKDDDLADVPGREADVALYIRCALGEEAMPRLRQEADRYDNIPSYAANFRRLGFTAIDSAVHASEPEGIRQGLAPFLDVVDEPVVRAITANDSIDEYLALLEAVIG